MLTATDEGTPPLSNKETVILEITDITDNASSFSKNEYRAQNVENNSPGVSVINVQAYDADKGQNARIACLVDSEICVSSVSTYFSINADKRDTLRRPFV